MLQGVALAKAQSGWGRDIRGVLSGGGFGQERTSLLLASTIGEHDRTQDTGLTSRFLSPTGWSRDCLRQLDLREQLRKDGAILIGFADDPGPVRLFGRAADKGYRMLDPDPDNSWTMYRVRIPVTLTRARPQDELEEMLDQKLE
jgi:hypothetical protein